MGDIAGRGLSLQKANIAYTLDAKLIDEMESG